MRNALRFTFAFLAFFFLKTPFAYSANVLGADIQWKHLANDTFEITIVEYRRCSTGSTNGPSTLTIISDSCSNTYSVSAGSYISWTIENIAPVCNDSLNTCSPSPPSGVPIVVQRHTAKYRIYLGGTYANCCWYKISVTMFNLESNITTGYADQTLISSAWLNRCIQDNSPRFMNTPLAIAYSGKDVVYNMGAKDDERDSLSYKLGAPSGGGTFTSPWSFLYPVTCYGGNNPNINANPPTGFNIDPLSGNIFFRPMQVQISIHKIEVAEWRKINRVYKIIGKLSRDMTFYIFQNAANTSPRMLGAYGFSFCANSENCFTIN